MSFLTRKKTETFWTEFRMKRRMFEKCQAFLKENENVKKKSRDRIEFYCIGKKSATHNPHSSLVTLLTSHGFETRGMLRWHD